MAALALLTAVVAFLVSFFTLIEKLRSLKARAEKPHALEPVLQDIAFSLRERDGKLRDLQRQLQDAMKRIDESRRVRFE